MTRRKGEAALDGWSIVHTAAGIGLGVLGLSWALALGLIVGYEVLEGGLRRIKVEEGGLFEHESWPNVVMDVVVGFGGWVIGAALRWLVA